MNGVSRLFLILAVGCISGCKGQKADKEKNNPQVYNYTLRYGFDLQGEIRVNDVVVEKSPFSIYYEDIVVDEFILDDGITTIEVELSSDTEPISKITQRDLYSQEKDFSFFMAGSKQDKYKVIKNFHFKQIPEPSYLVKDKWEVEVKRIYNLRGWKYSEDLSKWNQKELEKQVVKKYKYLLGLINMGDVDGLFKEMDFAIKEYFIANNLDKQEQDDFYKYRGRAFSNLAGLQPELESYNMRIMGQGRVVVLEKKEGRYKGQGILGSGDKANNQSYLLYVMLHKPKDSKEFQIVRFLYSNQVYWSRIADNEANSKAEKESNTENQ
ncbi:hypothetical protein HX052_10735 [Myroides marinus]|uniref:hypothetical protein n=1 Tax=Myroides marinus TaxID=703342 RepID=UPI0025763925|nr:hypothetical protein [Myroides marinus]MDM1390434.1 hypothetical protein [Myroides marinus]MDM1404574.1 hypothetical protein [Myroides marinus]